jgi:negative regulator of genetic competence, sporulation and motility
MKAIVLLLLLAPLWGDGINTSKTHIKARQKTFQAAFEQSYTAMQKSAYTTEREAERHFLKRFNQHPAVVAMANAKSITIEKSGLFSTGNFYFGMTDHTHGVNWWCRFERGQPVAGATYVDRRDRR